MSNQKDTSEIGGNSYGQGNVRNIEAIENKANLPADKPIYEFANKKTEKLVTALYMITDCMDTDDAIKAKLRTLGVSLLSDMYKLHILSPVEKNTHLTIALAHIGEIIAFVEIAHTIGYVSEMNARILKKEFNMLIEELHSYKRENEHSSFGGAMFENQKMSGFVLNEKLFEVEKSFPEIEKVRTQENPLIKTIKDKRTPSYTMSFTRESAVRNPIRTSSLQSIPAIKDNRAEKILGLIKDKRDVSIKDISVAFSDCSEKTIQRELNSLVHEGKIKKIGSKRWSRYQYI